ncbi:MAG: carbohydrate ABC transporter permease [Pseudomonadota bacterium]
MRAGAVIRLAILGAAAAVFLFPFAYMLAFSIKPVDEIFSGTLSLIPGSWEGLNNFPDALRAEPLLRYLLNGVIVCAGILVFQLIFAVPCAYALAKLRFRGREVLFGIVIFGLLVPMQATALPIYLGLALSGFADTYFALIAPFTASVFAVFLFRQFFRTIPDELLDAARLDGCSEASVMLRIVLPLTAPAATAFAIFSVVSHWNDLFWPIIAIRSPELNTPPLGILAFRSADAGDRYGELMAGTVIITAPLILAFLVAQRRFIEGISLGALKG